MKNNELMKLSYLNVEEEDVELINNVIRYVKQLQQERQELIDWLEHKKKNSYGSLKVYIIEILNKLKESEVE